MQTIFHKDLELIVLKLQAIKITKLSLVFSRKSIKARSAFQTFFLILNSSFVEIVFPFSLKMNDIFPGIDFGQKTVQKFGKNKEITILLTFLKNNDTSMLKFRNSEKATKIWSIFQL